MKSNRNKIVLVIVLGILLIFFLKSFIQFRINRIDNIYYTEFKNNLTCTMEASESFYMHELTPFTWEKMYIMKPYTSKKEMNEIVGIKWTTYNTYLGYLWEGKTYLGNNPLDDDIFHKLVFVNKEKVILDITIMRNLADFTNIDNIVLINEDFFQIDKTNKKNPIIKRIDV